jgi:hypothetical protein
MFSVTACDNSTEEDFIDVQRISFSTGRYALSYRLTTFMDQVQITEQEYIELNAQELGIFYYTRNMDPFQDDYRNNKTVQHYVPERATIKYGTYVNDDYGEHETTYYTAKVKSATDYFIKLKFDGNTATIKYYDFNDNSTKKELEITSADWIVTKQNGKITQIKNSECTIVYFVE